MASNSVNRLLSVEKLTPFFVHAAQVPYAILKLLPVQNKVVLISRNNLETCIPFKMLEEEIHRQHPRTKVVILNHYMKSRLSHIKDILVEMYHLATSRGCIIDSYVIAVSILKHKKQLTIIQVWHALGAIKQFGYMTLDKPAGNPSSIAKAMNMHGNYTYIACASPATVPIYSKTFNAKPSQIKVIGSPRIDYLLDKEVYNDNRKRMLAKYPQLKGKKVILYAPTFRKGHRINPQPLIEQLDDKKYTLIIKQHRLDKTKLPANDSIIQIRSELDSLELLAIADYVITDYSAITFEAAMLDKPLYFWNYDYDKYASECGFAINYCKEMPGIISRSAETIMTAIKQNKLNAKKIRTFANKWITTTDGNCTKRIVEALAI